MNFKFAHMKCIEPLNMVLPHIGVINKQMLLVKVVQKILGGYVSCLNGSAKLQTLVNFLIHSETILVPPKTMTVEVMLSAWKASSGLPSSSSIRTPRISGRSRSERSSCARQ